MFCPPNISGIIEGPVSCLCAAPGSPQTGYSWLIKYKIMFNPFSTLYLYVSLMLILTPVLLLMGCSCVRLPDESSIFRVKRRQMFLFPVTIATQTFAVFNGWKYRVWVVKFNARFILIVLSLLLFDKHFCTFVF